MSIQSLDREIAFITQAITDDLDENLHKHFIHDYYFNVSEISEALEDGLKIALGDRKNSNDGKKLSTHIAVMQCCDKAALYAVNDQNINYLTNMLNRHGKAWWPKWKELQARPKSGGRVISFIGNDNFKLDSLGKSFAAWKFRITDEFYNLVVKHKNLTLSDFGIKYIPPTAAGAGYMTGGVQGVGKSGYVEDEVGFGFGTTDPTEAMHTNMARVHGLDKYEHSATARVARATGPKGGFPEDIAPGYMVDKNNNLVYDLGISTFRKKITDVMRWNVNLVRDSETRTNVIKDQIAVKIRIASQLSRQGDAALWDKGGANLKASIKKARAETIKTLRKRYGSDPTLLAASPNPVTRARRMAAENAVGGITHKLKNGRVIKVRTKIGEKKVKKGRKKQTVKKKSPNKPVKQIKRRVSKPVSSKDKIKKVQQGPKTKSGNPDMRYKVNKEAWGAKGGGSHSPIGLIQLLNKALPDELKKNMTGVYPRSLEWRTGRFGQSAQVTNIVPFPNLTQIHYTYQKNPYEVFEPESGNPLSSAGRDPKAIIGGTIRELAQSIMGTRFGLVRTKRV